MPDSPGVPQGVAENTITLPYNDSDAVRKLFDDIGDTIAAIIVEPVAGNMGCVPPEPGFLETLREVTKAHGAVLIFDEVMCGFRDGEFLVIYVFLIYFCRKRTGLNANV